MIGDQLMKNTFVLLAFVLALTACGQANPPATVVQQDQLTATAASISQPTAPSVAPTTTVTVTTAGSNNTDWANTASVAGDYYIRGNPGAPIHLIDYSDFL